MEFLFELILELIFEGTFELSKSIKVPKAIRYPLILLICLFYIGIILLLVFLGSSLLTTEPIFGIILIIIAIIFIILSIIKFKQAYIDKKK